MKHVFFSFSLLLAAAHSSMAQTDPLLKFGDVPAETFTSQPWLADSSAGAYYLFDKGSSFFERNSDGFDVVFEKHARIRLLNKNAFRLAEMVLSLYSKGSRSITLGNFKGAVYNFDNGKVVTTKVDKSNIFKEQNGNFNQVKIAFPNVREGSVIEYTYRLVYPGFGFIPSWSFQGDYPVLWSEYEVTFPSLFNYMIEKHGYLRYSIDTTLYSTNSDKSVHHIWGMENVPALVKKEPYTTTLANHISRLDFQLASVRTNNYQKSYTNNWPQLADELMKRETFGTALTDQNRWMDDDLQKITGPEKNTLLAAQKIYYYLRDSFNCTNIENIYVSQTLKKTWEERRGTVADINLLLTAIYLRLGFDAAPVILSSRGHGVAYEAYPLLRDYNYVITRVKAGDTYYLLDASKDNAMFGQLPELCYNGSARIIEPEPRLIRLLPDSVTEKRNTSVVLRNSDTAGYSGRFYHTAGVFESMELRARLRRMKTENFFEAIHKTMASFKTMEAHGIDTLENDGGILAWYYNMKYHFTSERVYFNPIFHERINTNPFTSTERYYPVEMPYSTDYTYSLDMEVPKGYQLDEAPKPERFLLDDGEAGFFDYAVQVTGRQIHFSYHFVLRKTNIPVIDYPELRNFFARVISKQKEEFVFKKTN